MKVARFRILFWLVPVLVVASTSIAQVGTTSILGHVSDPAGAVLPRATVTLVSEATGATRTTTTDAVGQYQFLGLSPGNYTLQVEADGFRTHRRERIEALVDTPTRVSISMEVGAEAELIEVVGGVIGLQTETAAMGNPMSTAQVAGLPLEARNIVALLSLQTGAVFLPGTDEFDPRTGSVIITWLGSGGVGGGTGFASRWDHVVAIAYDGVMDLSTATGCRMHKGRVSTFGEETVAIIPKVLHEHINTAYPAHTCLIGTVLPSGFAQVTICGSTAVYDDEHFSLWERGRGSTNAHLADGTKMTIFFRKPPLRDAGLLPRGGIARFFDFQNRRFSAVVCDRCKYTEFYRTQASGLSKVLDFIGSNG